MSEWVECFHSLIHPRTHSLSHLGWATIRMYGFGAFHPCGYFGAVPCVSAMSFDHSACRSTGSTDRPMIFTLRLSNSGLMRAIYPSSVVQTGVKSLGCENSTAQEFPIQS